MGLLDDAIRQHLDLKRRHGADAGEVEKLERQAFGPIGSEDALTVPGTPPSALDAAEHELAAEEEEAYIEAEVEADEEWVTDHPAPAAAAPAAHTPPPLDPVAEPEPDRLPPPPAPREPVVEVPFEPVDAPRGGSVRADDVSDATVQFSALEDREEEEADPAPDAEPEEHDELEETPEFLQEAPEHDRLWFEQKPPKDFDF